MKIGLTKRKNQIVFWHILGWLILLLTDVLNSLIFIYFYKSKMAFAADFFLKYAFYITYFYYSISKLVPLLYKKQFKKFIAIELLICALFITWQSYVDLAFASANHYNALFIFYYLDYFIYYFGLSLGYKLLYDRFKTEKQLKENLQHELSFLRSQINPHFILNVLNNIVSLARTNTKEVEPSLLKLSSWMQYMVYDAGDKKVSLSSEMEYLRSYIDLQEQRFRNKVKVHIIMEDINENHEIEPMLLMPFLENAFKHGIGRFSDPQINIKISTNEDDLHFKVWNKFNAASVLKQNESSGIGLVNVKKRLNLLYDRKHELEITKDDNWFYVDLKINLT